MQRFIDLQNKANKYTEQLSKKPRIRIGSDISGVAAGSLIISDEFHKQIILNKLDVLISHVGGFGLSYAEPLIDIEMPDASRVFYSNVHPRIYLVTKIMPNSKNTV